MIACDRYNKCSSHEILVGMFTADGNVQRHQYRYDQQSQCRPPTRPTTLTDDKCNEQQNHCRGTVYYPSRDALSFAIKRSSSYPCRAAAPHTVLVASTMRCRFIISVASPSMHRSTPVERKQMVGLRVDTAAGVDHSTHSAMQVGKCNAMIPRYRYHVLCRSFQCFAAVLVPPQVACQLHHLMMIPVVIKQ